MTKAALAESRVAQSKIIAEADKRERWFKSVGYGIGVLGVLTAVWLWQLGYVEGKVIGFVGAFMNRIY